MGPAKFALAYAGVNGEPYPRIMLAGAISLRLVVLTRKILGPRGAFRFLVVTLRGYLVLTFFVATSTKSSANIGTAAAPLLATCGLVASLAGRTETLAEASVG